MVSRNSCVSYSYVPSGWDETAYRSLGGFTVVFLNFNKKSMIESSVNAALAQDYPLLDMLFLDDASTDGSGDIMETIVRCYNGRHKVRVVRNRENRGIPLQWNLAAALAKGEWLGMFCADDISHPNRVSLVADVISSHPTLKGLCTSGYEINPKYGTRTPILPDLPSKLVAGVQSLDELRAIDTPIIGATAFWHKSIFVRPLPHVRLDDVMLRWILQMQFRESEEPIWMWCSDVRAVEYYIGSGITNEMNCDLVEGGLSGKVWLQKRIAKRKQSRVIQTAWAGLVMYYRTNNSPAYFAEFAERNLLGAKIFNGNTLSRLALLPRVTWWCLSHGIRGFELLCQYFKTLTLEFLGLRVASGLFGLSVMVGLRGAIPSDPKERRDG